MGKDGAETIVYGRLFRRGTYRAKKSFGGHQQRQKYKCVLKQLFAIETFDFCNRY